MRDSAAFARFVFDWQLAPFQRAWHSLLRDHDRLVIFAPVEHGKTSHLAKAIPLWLIGRNPNSRGAIICETAEPAQRRLADLATLIESDAPAAQRLRLVFPHLRREKRPERHPVWNDSALTVERDLVSPDPTVIALGLEGPLQGSRLDWIVCDDIVGLRTALSKAGRRSVSRWFWGVAESRLVAGGKLWIIGTAWHPEDIMHEAAERGFCKRIFRVRSMPGDEEPAVSVASWPEVWPEQRLEEKRRSLPGHEWDRQLLCLTSPESERFFDREALRATRERGRGRIPAATIGPAARNGDLLLVGVDLASGEGGDQTALFPERIHGDGRREMLGARVGRWGQMEMLQQMLAVHRAYAPDTWCVESNGMQRMITQAIRDPRILQAAGATPEDLANFRVMATVTTGAAKHDPVLGIKGMALDFEAGKWEVPDTPEGRSFLDECESWTPDGHTGDLLSAAYQAEMGSRMLRRPRVM